MGNELSLCANIKDFISLLILIALRLFWVVLSIMECF